MTSLLSADALAQLSPLLGSLARMVAGGANLGDANLTNCTILGLNIGVATITLFKKELGRKSYFLKDDIGNKLVFCGCWLSTLEDFEKRCKEVYPKDPKAAYEEQIEILKSL